MNAVQFENWKTLSRGLAATAFPELTSARRARLVAAVESCIDRVACNGLETVDDWDQRVRCDNGLFEDSVSTRMDDYLFDHRYIVNKRAGERRGRFGTMVAACVRAGFDIAVRPSSGVVGFTLGDLRCAFQGAIPDWVASFFDPALPTDAGDGMSVWL